LYQDLTFGALGEEFREQRSLFEDSSFMALVLYHTANSKWIGDSELSLMFPIESLTANQQLTVSS